MMRYCALHTEASFYIRFLINHRRITNADTSPTCWPMFRLQIAEGSPIGQVPEQIEGYAAEVLCKSERVHVLSTDNGHQCTNLGLPRALGDKMESGLLGRWWNEHQSDMLMLLLGKSALVMLNTFLFSF